MIKENTRETKARCAFLITELAPGGAEKALFHLVSNLDRKRFEPVVFSLSGRERDVERSLVPLFRSNGIETIGLGLKSVKDLPRVLWDLRSELKRRRVCLLQTFMFHANILGRFAARLAGVPLVCSGVRVAERDAPLRLKLDRWTSGLVDVWIAVGESVADFSKNVGRLPRKRVVSIPNGVQLKKVDGSVQVEASGSSLLESARAAFVDLNGAPVDSRRKRLVAIGRLTRQKGFDLLLEGIARLKTPEFTNEWEVWVVGDGEERESLLKLREKLGLNGTVYFLGWRADVSEILMESELFLLSSRWEGMPNVLLEAAALGKPALCANAEGVAEILGENADPQIYSLDSADEQRQKLAKLLADETLRQTLGQKNRERVVKEFTVEKTAERYENLWLNLLEKKGVKFDFDAEKIQ